MSAYHSIKTQIKDIDCLMDALKEKGFNPQKHTEATNLQGYQGDKRADTAEVVIPRSQVGSASNDIGFKKQEDGTFKAIISSYDSGRYNQKWLEEVTQIYTEKKTHKIARSKNLTLSKKQIMPNGTVRLIYVKA